MKGREGYFLHYTGTDKNIVYLDSKTRQVKTEKHAMFDEAHFTTSSSNAIPPTALALREAGYTQNIKRYNTSSDDDSILIKLLSPHATTPTRGFENAAR